MNSVFRCATVCFTLAYRSRPGASRAYATPVGGSGRGGRREGQGRMEREQKKSRKTEVDPARYTCKNVCTYIE